MKDVNPHSLLRAVKFLSWRRAYEFYRQRKNEAYSRLRGESLFQRFAAFVRWRLRKSLSLGYASSPRPEN